MTESCASQNVMHKFSMSCFDSTLRSLSLHCSPHFRLSRYLPCVVLLYYFETDTHQPRLSDVIKRRNSFPSKYFCQKVANNPSSEWKKITLDLSRPTSSRPPAMRDGEERAFYNKNIDFHKTRNRA